MVFDQITEINETLASDMEALRTEDVQGEVNSNRDDLQHLTEKLVEMNNSLSLLTPEVRYAEGHFCLMVNLDFFSLLL